MKKCKECKDTIADDANFCQICGASQDSHKQAGIIIQNCRHCDGAGECRKGKTLNRIHSCRYCISKAGKINGLFLIVPCGYCGGKGRDIIDLKPQKTDGKNKGRE